MAKIMVYYSVMDWCNSSIVRHLQQLKHSVDIQNITDVVVDLTDKASYRHDAYINRTYPSYAYERAHNHLKLSLELTRHLESQAKTIINSFAVTFLDYSKSEASNRLSAIGIPTPGALLVSDQKAAMSLADTLEFPKIVKMDTGGRALNVFKVNTKEEYVNVVSKLSYTHHLVHIEDFYKPPGFVTRVFVLNYTFQVAYKRLVRTGEWLGSHSQGSKVEAYPDISQSLVDLTTKAAKQLDTPIVGFDIIESEYGPYIVDVNPTPVFSEEYVSLFGFDPTECIAHYIHERLATKI